MLSWRLLIFGVVEFVDWLVGCLFVWVALLVDLWCLSDGEGVGWFFFFSNSGWSGLVGLVLFCFVWVPLERKGSGWLIGLCWATIGVEVRACCWLSCMGSR